MSSSQAVVCEHGAASVTVSDRVRKRKTVHDGSTVLCKCGKCGPEGVYQLRRTARRHRQKHGQREPQANDEADKENAAPLDHYNFDEGFADQGFEHFGGEDDAPAVKRPRLDGPDLPPISDSDSSADGMHMDGAVDSDVSSEVQSCDVELSIDGWPAPIPQHLPPIAGPAVLPHGHAPVDVALAAIDGAKRGLKLSQLGELVPWNPKCTIGRLVDVLMQHATTHNSSEAERVRLHKVFQKEFLDPAVPRTIPSYYKAKKLLTTYHEQPSRYLACPCDRFIFPKKIGDMSSVEKAAAVCPHCQESLLDASGRAKKVSGKRTGPLYF
jgi:hypothetical protein